MLCWGRKVGEECKQCGTVKSVQMRLKAVRRRHSHLHKSQKTLALCRWTHYEEYEYTALGSSSYMSSRDVGFAGSACIPKTTRTIDLSRIHGVAVFFLSSRRVSTCSSVDSHPVPVRLWRRARPGFSLCRGQRLRRRLLTGSTPAEDCPVSSPSSSSSSSLTAHRSCRSKPAEAGVARAGLNAMFAANSNPETPKAVLPTSISP